MTFNEVVSALGIVGGIAAGVTIYLARYKLGHRIGETRTYSFEMSRVPAITHVTLTNMKDRATPIFAIYAVDGDVSIQLREFAAPIVLQPFDSLQVKIPPVSEYTVDNKTYAFDCSARRASSARLFYATTGRVKECERMEPPPFGPKRPWSRRSFTQASIHYSRWRGQICSHNVIYAVEYSIDGLLDFAFVDKHGTSNGGRFSLIIPGEILADAQAVADFIASDQPHVDNIRVSKVDGWYRKFEPTALRDGNTDERTFTGSRLPAEIGRPSAVGGR